MTHLSTHPMPLPVTFKPGMFPSAKTKNDTLESIMANAEIGIWAFDINSRRVSLCATAKRFLNLEGRSDLSFFQFLRSIRPAYRRSFLMMANKLCSQTPCFVDEVKLMAADTGEPRWFKVTGNLYAGYIPKTEQYMGTITDITKDKIEKLRKDDCMAMLSHELRSPLTTIKLYVQMVMAQAKVNKDVATAERLFKADTQLSSMTRMIDSFLTMSAAANAKMELYAEEFDMIRLLHDVTAEMKIKHPANHFILEFSSKVRVIADREKIAQVLVNYISNAIKYSPIDSLIVVKCTTNAGNVDVAVKDVGNGISPADQNGLFERFYRVKNLTVKGFGLGLYLVKQIIEQHQGKVWLNSMPGKGSTFYFNIPYLAVQL